MAAGVPHLRGLQQHYPEKQGALCHDHGDGDEEEREKSYNHRKSVNYSLRSKPLVIQKGRPTAGRPFSLIIAAQRRTLLAVPAQILGK